MGSINSFNYTEPVGGTKFRTYESGGFHTQVVHLGDTDGASLPHDSTYGLSVDIKRVADGVAINSYITDPTDSDLQAAVLDEIPAGTEAGLGVRLIGTADVQSQTSIDTRTLMARLVWLFEQAYELDSSEITPEQILGD